MEEAKVPPHNIESEKAVLGSCLLDPDAIGVAMKLLETSDFYSSAHQLIFGAMCGLAALGRPVDLVTLHDSLRQEKKIEQIGGMAYIASLESSVMTTTNIAYHARIVREYAIEREILDETTNLLTELQDNEGGNAVMARISVLEEKRQELGILFGQLEAENSRKESVTMREFEELGLEEGDRQSLWGDVINQGDGVLLAGEEKIGKTIFVSNLFVLMAGGGATNFLGMPVSAARPLIIEREVGYRFVKERMQMMLLHANECGIDPEAVRERLFLIPTPILQLATTSRDRSEQQRIQQDRAFLIEQIEKVEPNIIVIDPMYLFLPTTERDAEQVADVLNFADSLRKKYGLAVILVHHLRKTETRQVTRVNPIDDIRGHSMFKAWPDTIMAFDWPSANARRSRTHAALWFRFRNAPERDPIILKRPDGSFMWFSIDPNWGRKRAKPGGEAETETKTETTERQEPSDENIDGIAEVILTLETNGPQRYKKLRELIQRTYYDSLGRLPSERSVERWIARAVEIGRIVKSDDGDYRLNE